MSTAVSPASTGMARGESKRPWIGILGVLLAAVASTLTSRLTTNGLADIRGAVGAGFDEGAWITTAYTVAQMLVGPIAIWIAKVVGIRRVLLCGVAMFGIAEALIPGAPNLSCVICLQAIAGLGSGTFIPLAIGFIRQNLPARLQAFGIAAYAMNIELSLNIAATLEGWYSEHLGWQWIFWQNAVLSLPVIICFWGGIPSAPVDRKALRQGDYRGMVLGAAGLSLLYAALDQGDRLQWFDSQVLVVLVSLGVLALAWFLLHETYSPNAGIDFSILARRNVALILILLAVIRFLIVSATYLVPQFMINVRGLRPLEIGDVMLWVALPQFILAPTVAWLLNHFDGRLIKVIGILLLVAANVEAFTLTSDWAEPDFILPELLQAAGQSLALTSLIVVVLKQSRPEEVLAFGAFVQTARLFGGEVGYATLQVFCRIREQTASNLIGLHAGAYDPETMARLQNYASSTGAQAPGLSEALPLGLLDRAIRTQAFTLAYADGFLLTACVAAFGLLLVLLICKVPDTPAR